MRNMEENGKIKREENGKWKAKKLGYSKIEREKVREK
jgi:hypothetical protein